MTVIKCKMCGGDMELSEDRSFGTCEYCGSVMTLPGVDDEQMVSAFNRGNDFRRIGEFDKALAVYERIVEQDDKNAEAHWCCALCRFGIEYVEDPETHQWFPTCHRVSFDSFLKDVDYLAALEHSDAATRSQYEKEGEKIAQVQKGILATSQQEEPFDVFLCYKESEEDGSRTRDSALAQEIYYELTEEGRRVFFARITLEDKAGIEYEPYIFAALQSAKVMIVVGTTAAHLNAVWVKNEWSRFLALMKTDRSRLLIPCYRDMDPYDLPEQLSILQAYDMGKIGFIQDLIRGVNKVLNGTKEEKKEEEEIQGESGNLSALLKRGELALEDGEWQKADEFFENALNLDAENYSAYLGKFLAEQHRSTLEKVTQDQAARCARVNPETLKACPEDTQRIDRAVEQYGVEGRLSAETIKKTFNFDLGYAASAAKWKQLLTKEEEFWSHKLFQRALRFAQRAEKEPLEQARDRVLSRIRERYEAAKLEDEKARAQVEQSYRAHLDEAEKKVAQLSAEAHKAEETRLQNQYESACQKRGDVRSTIDLRQAETMFQELGEYRDSKEQAEACRQAILDLEAKAREMAEKAAAARRKKLLIIAAAVLVVVVLAYYLIACVILPQSRYTAAEELLVAGKYEEAAQAFAEMGEYKDAADMVQEVKYVQAEALFQQGDLALARTKFVQLGNYKDASDRVNECKYKQAEEFFQQEKFNEAQRIFRELGNYKDAPDRMEECQKRWDENDKKQKEITYSQAEKLFQQGKLEDAQIKFQKLGDYKDALDRAKECKALIQEQDNAEAYTRGVEYLQQGDLEAAESVFEELSLSSYKDASNQLDEIHAMYYETGEGYLSEGKKAQAAIYFSKADTYKDGIVRGKELWEDMRERQRLTGNNIVLQEDGQVVDEEKVLWEPSDGVIEITSGADHILGLKADGTVLSYSEFPLQPLAPDPSFVSDWANVVSISGNVSCVFGLLNDGTVIRKERKDIDFDYSAIDSWKDIVAISASTYQVVGLKADGTVVATGKNTFGECSLSDWSNIIAVTTGYRYTVGLKADGTRVSAGKISDTDVANISFGEQVDLQGD